MLLKNITLRTVFLSAICLLVAQAIYAQTPTNLVTTERGLPCLDKTFTILAHVVRDSTGAANISEEEIQEAVDSLNLRFAPICASFRVCEYRYIDNYQFDTLDIESEMWNELQIKYNEDNRINLYFVGALTAPDEQCGFANQEGIRQPLSGGVVVQKEPCVDAPSKTLAHEIGHFFGLLHTFEDEGEELVDRSNCETVGDLICDTQADPFRFGVDNPTSMVDVANGCRFVDQRQDANTEYYRPDVGNSMSYYPAECDCGFTTGQLLRMAEVYLETSPRFW